MLNRAKLLQELQGCTTIFVDHSNEYTCARRVWQQIAADPTLVYKVRTARAPWLVPTWSGALDAILPIERMTDAYRVLSVDGSQIYPDRHQGTSCYLINIGSVDFAYGAPAGSVKLQSEPHVFMAEEQESSISVVDLVNGRRHEYELSRACAMSREAVHDRPHALLLDGSLIFWHLEKDVQLKELFLENYCQLLHELYEAKMPIAGYISMPKSKELVNLIRLALCNFVTQGCDAYRQVDHIVDAAVAQFFLQPYTRSIVFKSNASVCQYYPEHLKPHFFYMHVGVEIARIEIPAWVAADDQILDRVGRIIADQTIKGAGYPIVLAEAHEQAVVKGPDREFFYHCIAKIGVEQKRHLMHSPKSGKKRYMAL